MQVGAAGCSWETWLGLGGWGLGGGRRRGRMDWATADGCSVLVFAVELIKVVGVRTSRSLFGKRAQLMIRD